MGLYIGSTKPSGASIVSQSLKFGYYDAASAGQNLTISALAGYAKVNGSTGVNGVSVNAHYLNTSSAPSLTSCGSGSPSVATGSSNSSGQFTTGTAGTACTITFANAYPTHAFCTISNASASAGTPYVSAQSKSAFTVTSTVANKTYSYTCGGN